jgi:hypothetical protein
MSKANLFQIATKELSQNRFFTWLIQWADPSNEKHDKELNITVKRFVKLLSNDAIEIIKISAGRQWNNIGIWAEVNDDIFIAIKDKTNTGEYSEQLERYEQISQEHYKNKRSNLFFVIFKSWKCKYCNNE